MRRILISLFEYVGPFATQVGPEIILNVVANNYILASLLVSYAVFIAQFKLINNFGNLNSIDLLRRCRTPKRLASIVISGPFLFHGVTGPRNRMFLGQSREIDNRPVKQVKYVFFCRKSRFSVPELSNIAQTSDIIHFELQFPACDIQTHSVFNGPNQQNQGENT